MSININGIINLQKVISIFETQNEYLKNKLLGKGELQAACYLALETLKKAYDCKDTEWRKIRDRIQVSFIKDTKFPKVMNTSVTCGAVVQMKKKPENICVLNCGTGGIRYQYYKIEDGIVVVSDELKPTDAYSLSDLKIPNLYEGKLDVEFIKTAVARDLGECKSKNNLDNCKYVALITGDLRAARENKKGFTEKEINSRQELFETMVQSIFTPLKIEPWNGKSYFMSQTEEGTCEILALENLLSGLDPKLRVLITFGIGRGSCQWSNSKLIVGNDNGMNRPDKMMEMSMIVEKKFEESEYVSLLLENISADSVPVIALKSGTLIYLGKDKELQKIFGLQTP